MDNKFSKYYSDNSLWEKIRKFSKDAGAKVVYAVLLLYYAMGDKSVSIRNKVMIAASLGYFILPTDAIFDLTPVIGYSDDLGVLLFALTQIASSVTPEVREKSRIKMNEWFSNVDESELTDLEKSFTEK